MEAAISSSLAHPNVVATYTYAVKPLRDSTHKLISDAIIVTWVTKTLCVYICVFLVALMYIDRCVFLVAQA
jgi:hypothetical protein